MEELWKLLSDTDRVNREVGLPSIQFSAVPHPLGGSVRRGVANVAGQRIAYVEEPFEWEAPRYYRFKRIFETGPFSVAEGGTEFRDIEGGTEIFLWAEIAPKPGMGWVAKTVLGDQIKRMQALFQSIDAAAAGQEFPKQATRSPGLAREALVCVERMVSLGASRSMSQKVADFVLGESPARLTAIRPFEAADQLHIDRRDAAITMLTGVRGGLLDLRWRILCPNCRGNRTTIDSLSRMEASYHCESCLISFDAHYDSNVELVFRPAKAIRPLEGKDYCLGGPQTTPHILAQWKVEPRSERLVAHLRREHVRLRSPQATSAFSISQGESAAFVLSAQGLVQMPFDQSGLRLVNETDSQVVFLLEDQAWRTDILTAAEAMHLPQMSQWFSSEVLSPERDVSMERLTVLFSDLSDSTEMYKRLGDGPSYRKVRDHLDAVKRIIENSGGTLVKTMGDGAMAVFPKTEFALNAAGELVEQATRSGLGVKVGLAEGPALVIQANEHLDYFGATVNQAAKLQQAASPGEILMNERAAVGIRGEDLEEREVRGEIARVLKIRS